MVDKLIHEIYLSFISVSLSTFHKILAHFTSNIPSTRLVWDVLEICLNEKETVDKPPTESAEGNSQNLLSMFHILNLCVTFSW